MDSLLAIANDDAGTSTDQAISSVIDTLSRAYDVEMVTTSTPDELDEVLKARPDLDVVVVLGGDGSLHAVVAALYASGRLADVVVGLVPLGTGNDFAATLQLAEEPEAAARILLDKRVREVDLLIDEENRVVVNAAHVGVGAEAAAAARPWKKLLGPVGYAIGALAKGLSTSGAHVQIQIDGETLRHRGPVMQVAVGNGRFVGGGTELLPHADPSDGQLDLAVSYAASRWRRLAYARHLSRGEHHHRDDVVYHQGTEVTVRGEALRCTSDGEISEPSKIHSWRVQPGALRMYV